MYSRIWKSLYKDINRKPLTKTFVHANQHFCVTEDLHSFTLVFTLDGRMARTSTSHSIFSWSLAKERRSLFSVRFGWRFNILHADDMAVCTFSEFESTACIFKLLKTVLVYFYNQSLNNDHLIRLESSHICVMKRYTTGLSTHELGATGNKPFDFDLPSPPTVNWEKCQSWVD